MSQGSEKPKRGPGLLLSRSCFFKTETSRTIFFLSRILIDKVVKEKAGKDITDDQDRDQEIEFRDDLHLDSGVKGLDVFHENLHLLGGNLHQVKSYLSLA